MNKITTSLLIYMVATSLATSADAQPKQTTDPAVSRIDASASGLRWKANINGEDEHELRQSFVAADGRTWILASARTAAAEPGQWNDVRLICVDAAGQETARYDIGRSLPAKNVTRFDGVGVRKDGNVAVFVTTSAGELLAVTLNARTGAPITQMRLGRTRELHYVSEIVAAEEGRLLLIGRLEDRAWLMKLDADLGIRWERTLDDEELTVLYDAAVGPDGGIAAVGGQLLETDVRLWAGVLTAEGAVLHRKHFPGREGRIARKADGYAIVHHVPGAAGFDVVAHGYSLALEETWSATLAEDQRLPVTFEIASRPNGGWLVAGPKADRLWVAELRDGGATAWSYTLASESSVFERLWNVDTPMVTGGDLLIPFTLHTVDERRRARRVVRVIRLPLRA